MRESTTSSFVRLYAAQNNDLLWRNNVGVAPPHEPGGRPIRYGLANESAAMNQEIKSSDLIGIHPVLITPAMVGTIIGQFLAVEMKHEGWIFNHTDKELAQKKFHDIVKSSGGRAGFATNVHDYIRILQNE